ncbi:MAG: SIMPL domain-containing protein, partial [Opitutales bacterium]
MKKFLVFFSTFFCSFLFAHDNEHANDRWIHVTGVGESVASPDLAILRLGVISTAKSAKLATELNNASIAKIFRVLEDLGLSMNDLETDRFQLVPQREYRKGLAPLITGYQVTNTLVLRIRELDRVGEIMQEAIYAGGNNFESLTYSVE